MSRFPSAAQFPRLRFVPALLGLLFLALLGVPAAQAATKGTAIGSEMQGFGRVVFSFDREMPARVRMMNAVLIVEFDEPVTIDLEKLATQLPRYVSIARMDPDGRSLRLGLTDRLKADLKPAGERLYLDLMPSKWQGMPPPLPAEVVQDLVRRARQAEDQIRRLTRENDKAVNRELDLRVGTTPRFRRAIFVMPRTAPVAFEQKDGEMRLIFDANFLITEELIRSRLAGLVREVEVQPGEESLRIMMRAESGFTVRGFREDDSFTLDFARADGGPIEGEPGTPPAKAEDGSRRGEASQAAARPATAAVPLDTLVPTGRAIEARLEAGLDPDGFALRLAHLGATPVAMVQRGRELLILLETGDSLNRPELPEALNGRLEGLSITRLRTASLIRLTPRGEGQFWLRREEEDLILQHGRGMGADGFAGAGIVIRRAFDGNGRESLAAIVGPKGALHVIEDPTSGQRLALVPVPRAESLSPKPQVFAEFTIEPTLAGFAVLPIDEAVTLKREGEQLLIGHEIKLTLSNLPAETAETPRARQPLILDTRLWLEDSRGPIRQTERVLFLAAAESPRVTRSDARLRLARFYLANGFDAEASAVLEAIAVDDQQAAQTKTMVFHRALAAAMMGRLVDAGRFLADPAIALDDEQKLIQAVVDAKAMRYPQALAQFRQALGALDQYPEPLQVQFRRLAIEAAIEAGDPVFARDQILAFERVDTRYRDPHTQQLLAGRLAEMQGRFAEAYAAYSLAAQSRDRRIEAEARFGRATAGLAEAKISPEDARAEFETLTAIWRRSETEVKALERLGEIYAGEGRWREAFLATQRATAIMPEHPATRRLEETMGRRFENLFLDQEAAKLSKVESLALYQEFRQLMPAGRRGDAIARRLADRLYDLDLAGEAAEILEHQVKHRLEGVARASVATRLALMHLEARKPVEALSALRSTRLASMPAELRRARTLVEARALGELYRTDLAIEVLANESGDDVDRLRADIFWKGKKWREAGESYERVLGDAWQGEAMLTEGQRLDALRAGLAYVLAEEKLSLDRLRGRYLAKMAKTEDAGAFNLITRDQYSRPQAFRDVARSVVNADTMTEFLAAYRRRYPDQAGTARPVRSAGQERQSALESPDAAARPSQGLPGAG
ncbi:hypothetical protein [Rhabdaerophilum calidifontis]|uniref:hypothetical protein n=1 Tax=Rhabdaerophilum calidifontis TaxID=2604328 RepID=UPI00123BC865|nr:hypothetical protein [Rhabdaerophilum calidifontis]